MPIVNYFEVAANFELPAVEALAFFQAKGLKPTFAWQDMLGDEHDLAVELLVPGQVDRPESASPEDFEGFVRLLECAGEGGLHEFTTGAV